MDHSGQKFRKAYVERYGKEPFEGVRPFDGVDRIGKLPSGRARRRRQGLLGPKPEGYRDPTTDKTSEENQLYRDRVDSNPVVSENEHGTEGAPAAPDEQLNKGDQMTSPTNPLFKPAERTKVHLRMALTGPSGSGKTYTSLLYARAVAGMDGKIAIVDSEHSRASYYADNDEFRGNDGTAFCTVAIEPPYTIDKWLRAIKAAEDGGFSVLILDSITQAWRGKGGLLEQKEELDRRPGANHYANWAPITKQHQAFIGAMLNSNLHLIVTMRSKQDYALEEKDGKKVPVKLGMAPEQREGMEYEFAIVLDMGMDHSAKVSKDITRIYNDKTEGVFKPVAADAMLLAEWLTGGAEVVPVNAIPDEVPVTAAPAVLLTPNNGPAKSGRVGAPQPVTGGGDRQTPEQRQRLGVLCTQLKVSVLGEIEKRKDKGWKLPLTQAQTEELIADLEAAASHGGAA